MLVLTVNRKVTIKAPTVLTLITFSSPKPAASGLRLTELASSAHNAISDLAMRAGRPRTWGVMATHLSDEGVQSIVE